MKKAAEIKESWMPDEPTDKEMVELLTEIRSGLKNEIEIKDMQYLLHYFWRSDIPIIDAIRRRIERKVSGERIGKLLEDLQGSILFNVMHHVCILHRDEARSHILAMLKELGWEVFDEK